ncbi:MAG TPA: nucleotidyltransferase domain-containing protein [Solirubrobacteraceae bacterium]|nr:nucleotidyltransferase domain-containing protein [Solirubrobacteraceae bacterium]
MLSEAEIDEVVEQIVARLRPQRVIVFGAYGKGTATEDSDLDVMAVVETDLPRAQRASGIPPYLPDSLVRLDLVVHTPEEVEELARDRFSLVSSALRRGRVVYEA